MAKVTFYRGSRSKYDEELYADGLFFATDTQELIMNGQVYGYGSGDQEGISSIEYNEPSTLTITYTDGTSNTLELQIATAGGSIDDSVGGLISAEDIYKLSQLGECIIETIKVNGEALGVENKAVNIDLTDIQDDILTNKVSAADSSITITEGDPDNGTPIAVNVASDGGIVVTENGIAVDDSALVQYVGDGKAIAISDVESGNQKTVSLTLNSASGNILTATGDGLYAGLEIQSLDPSDDNILKSYKLVGLDADGNTTQLGATIDILKDQLLQEVGLEEIPEGYTNAGDNGLKFVFVLADGTTTTQYISLAQFLEEAEAGDGIELNNGVYSVKINTTESEKNSEGVQYIHVDADGVSVVGINDEIALAQSTVTALVEVEEARAKAAEAALDKTLTQAVADITSGDEGVLEAAKAYTDSAIEAASQVSADDWSDWE